jgi:hypothetical protein
MSLHYLTDLWAESHAKTLNPAALFRCFDHRLAGSIHRESSIQEEQPVLFWRKNTIRTSKGRRLP